MLWELQATKKDIQKPGQRCENCCGHLASFSEGKRLLYLLVFGNPRYTLGRMLYFIKIIVPLRKTAIHYVHYQ
jgi:hypothetical protein